MSKIESAMPQVLVRNKNAKATAGHRKALWRSPTFHIFFVLVGMSVFRVSSLALASRDLLDCAGCLGKQSLVFETRFLFIAASLHLLGNLFASKVPRLIARLLVCSLLLLYAADLVLLKELHVRLNLQEVIQFSGEHAAISGFLMQLARNAPILAVLAIVFGIIFLRYLGCRHWQKQSPMFALVGGGCVVVAGFAEPVNYHLYYLQNPIEAFFQTATRSKPYTPAFKEHPPVNTRADGVCMEGMGSRPNIILVVVESLSMYHSKLFSGMNDWTPEFDALSKNGRRFSNFYANGVTTEQGLVSLLTGEPPIEKGWEDANNIFEQFRQPSQSIPRMLKTLDYRTVFLTTGDLGFLDKGAWLSDIGFSFVEGHDAPYYKGMKRFQFEAATDDALYGRSLRRLANMQASSTAPVFMMLETVTTHAPYIDPVSGNISQESVFRYADHALGDFVRSLESRGFFNNGYVLVMGDHRAMTPASAQELSAYGDRAYARLPFSIIGNKLNGEIEQASFSQTDLLPSLRHWLGAGSQCLGSDQGVFLPKTEKTPACIFTRRSYAQNNVYAQCGSDDYAIQLDGDDTRFVGTTPGPASLLQEVHALRFNQGFRPDIAQINGH
ncbi:MAG: LTA synthase family protein [Rhodoferax sp.]|nr:LTA synthase family protein [Rhodoferax sp.]